MLSEEGGSTASRWTPLPRPAQVKRAKAAQAEGERASAGRGEAGERRARGVGGRSGSEGDGRAAYGGGAVGDEGVGVASWDGRRNPEASGSAAGSSSECVHRCKRRSLVVAVSHLVTAPVRSTPAATARRLNGHATHPPHPRDAALRPRRPETRHPSGRGRPRRARPPARRRGASPRTDSPRGQKRILAIEHPLVYRLRHGRWRGATSLETDEGRFWLCARCPTCGRVHRGRLRPLHRSPRRRPTPGR